MDTGLPVALPLSHGDTITGLAFSPDGKIILTGSADKTARLWKASPRDYHRACLPHEGGVDAVAFSPDGKLVVTGSVDKKARLWDVATGAQRACFPHRYPVHGVAF